MILAEICRRTDNDIYGVCRRCRAPRRLNAAHVIVGKAYSQIFTNSTTARPTKRSSAATSVSTSVPTASTRPPADRCAPRWPPTRAHLEAVDPVLEGIAQADDRLIGTDPSVQRSAHPVLPVLAHGDASFAGRGWICTGRCR